MKHRPRAKIRKITARHWRDALSVLQGSNEFPRYMRYSEVQMLRSYLRGSFAKGMTEEEALEVLKSLNWRSE